MTSLEATARALRSAAETTQDIFRPVIFDLGSETDRDALDALLGETSRRSGGLVVHDTIRAQLAELFAIREPARAWSRRELDERVTAHLAGREATGYGRWIWFPWSRRLAHVLPKDELREVRTDRNRFKITAAEQARLGAARIGVVGLSVGNAAAITLALEGVGGSFRLADFDELSLSNMNRLRASVTDLGVDKTVLAARAMFEIDPYLDVECLRSGVDESNVDAMLSEGGRLDLIVEESDDLFVKAVVRERARAFGIPVVMDTSDRGLLDVERFDREPSRPVFHGLLGGVPASAMRGLSTRDKVPFVLALLGGHAMSERLAASLPEVKESIGSWPQLASAVALGGAVVADVARRILLGELTCSGRFYVDLEECVREDAATLREPVPPAPPREIAPEARRPAEVGPPPEDPSGNDPATIRWLVAHAVLAPSAHNAQPWSFAHREGRLELLHDPTRDLPSLDFERGATWVAFGAAAENIEIAARSIGLEPTFEERPDPDRPELVGRFGFAKARPVASELAPWITRRVTNRRVGRREPLDPSAARALVAEADAAGARLQLVEGEGELAQLAELVAAADRLGMLHAGIHRETMAGLRWTRAEVESHRDGIDVATMELSEADRAGVQLLGAWPIARRLKAVGGGRALETTSRRAVASAAAMGLVTTRGLAADAYLRGGRAVQRVWLTATRLGLALQPMTALPYLFARVERGGGEGLDTDEVAALRALRARYRAVFDVPPGRAEVLLLRLAHAEAPTARALRRPLDDVLRFEGREDR